MIGFGRAAGLTKNKIMEFIGISKPTFYQYEEKFATLIATFEEKAKLLVAASIAIQVRDATKVREAQYQRALTNFDHFLESGDDNVKYKASVDTLDRYEGKATQRIEEQRSFKTEVKVILPPEELQVLRSLVQGSARLLLPEHPPSDYIEAEAIESVNESSPV